MDSKHARRKPDISVIELIDAIIGDSYQALDRFLGHNEPPAQEHMIRAMSAMERYRGAGLGITVLLMAGMEPKHSGAAQGGVHEMTPDQLHSRFDKLADAPIEQAFADARAAMAALSDVATGPELNGALLELRAAAAELRGMVSVLGDKADRLIASLGKTLQSTNRLIDRTGQTVASLGRQGADRSPLLADIRGLLRELDGAARSMRLLAEYLERNPGALISGRSASGP